MQSRRGEISVADLKSAGKSAGQFNGHCFTQGGAFRGLKVVFPSSDASATLKGYYHYTGCRNVKYFYYFLPTSVGTGALWVFFGDGIYPGHGVNTDPTH